MKEMRWHKVNEYRRQPAGVLWTYRMNLDIYLDFLP
jgi:hypothetical protein